MTTNRTPVPPEPPVGTWMKDRHGAATQRQKDGWGQPGTVPGGKWEAMWAARGPYVKCGPWGRDLPDYAEIARDLIAHYGPDGPGEDPNVALVAQAYLDTLTETSETP